jgi:hypothetical protein
MNETTPVEESSDDDEEPMERYHIEVPPPLPGTASRQSLRAENMMLRDIIVQAGIALEEDYAQMKLMGLENERLRKRAFEKEKRKAQKNKQSSGQARHMTAAENLDLLARQDWESRMKDVFKEAAPQFKVLKKSILDYHKQIEKAKQVAERTAKKAEREAKKVAAAAEKAARARGRVRGNRGGGRGRGRSARGRGGASTGIDDSDAGLEASGTPDSSESGSDSDSESEAEILIPRSRRQRPVRVIQGRCEEAAEQERSQHIQPRPRPRPLPHMRPPPLETGDDGEAEISRVADAVGDQNEPEVLQEEDTREQAASPKSHTNLLPRVMEDDLEGEGRSLEARLTMQSTEIETRVDPPRRRNPRRK